MYKCNQGWQLVSGDAFWEGRINGDINNKNIGSVGIGIASPAQKLDVAGAVQMAGFKMPTGAALDMVLVSDANGIGTWKRLNEINTGISECSGSSTADISDPDGKLICGEDLGGVASEPGCTTAINTITGTQAVSASVTGTAGCKSASIGLNIGNTALPSCQKTAAGGKVYWDGSKLVCDTDQQLSAGEAASNIKVLTFSTYANTDSGMVMCPSAYPKLLSCGAGAFNTGIPPTRGNLTRIDPSFITGAGNNTCQFHVDDQSTLWVTAICAK